MAGVSDSSIGEALTALASPDQVPAAGVATALSCAHAAALTELSAGLAAKRLSEDEANADAGAADRMDELSERAAILRQRLLQIADEDVEAYAAVARAADVPSRAEGLARAADPPLAIAVAGSEIAEAASEVAGRSGAWAFGADAVVASGLAAACARGAAVLVAANLGAASDDPRIAHARDAADRATEAAATSGHRGR